MDELTNAQERFQLEMLLQGIPIDPPTLFRLARAWKVETDHAQGTSTWYAVELQERESGILLRGMIDCDRRVLYLDIGSTLLLVESRIAAQLNAFNAGHHWRYKGL